MTVTVKMGMPAKDQARLVASYNWAEIAGMKIQAADFVPICGKERQRARSWQVSRTDQRQGDRCCKTQ